MPSIMKQLFRDSPRARRGLGRGPQGFGQVTLSSTTSCNNWVTVPQSDPMWANVLAQASGFLGQPSQEVSGAFHFTFTPALMLPGTMLNGVVSPGQPAGTLFMKYDPGTSKIQVCLGGAGAVASPTAATAAASSSTPYIIAGIAGVVILGALVYYATE
jgi:hypothetical protein